MRTGTRLMTHTFSPCSEPSTALAAGEDEWEKKVRSGTPLNVLQGDFPGGPGVETLFQRRGLQFDPCLGT